MDRYIFILHKSMYWWNIGVVESEKGALSKAAFYREIGTWKFLAERELFKRLFYKNINNRLGLKTVLKTMAIYLLFLTL